MTKPIHGEPKPKNVPQDMVETPPVECTFKVGDVVTFTNDYGVKFSPHTVRGFTEKLEQHQWGRFIYINTDCWWMPVRPDHLTLLP